MKRGSASVSDKLAAKAQKFIDEYKPVKEREVKDHYTRLQRDGIVVAVEGNEAGKFWFRDEYDINIYLGKKPRKHLRK